MLMLGSHTPEVRGPGLGDRRSSLGGRNFESSQSNPSLQQSWEQFLCRVGAEAQGYFLGHSCHQVDAIGRPAGTVVVRSFLNHS